MFLFVSPGSSWSWKDHGVSNEMAWRVSLVPRPLYRAFIPRASVHYRSADPMSQRFGHPHSQIPTPSDGSVEQVTYPLAREYVGQGRLLMRDYKCEHVTRYLSAFIYTTSFSTVFRWEGPFMNGRRKCERVAYDVILDRYAVLYIQRQSRLLMIYIKMLVWKLLSFLSFRRRQELCWNTLRKYQPQYLLSSCLKTSRLPWGRETTASRREPVVGAFVKNHGTPALVTHNTFITSQNHVQS